MIGSAVIGYHVKQGSTVAVPVLFDASHVDPVLLQSVARAMHIWLECANVAKMEAVFTKPHEFRPEMKVDCMHLLPGLRGRRSCGFPGKT